MSSCCPGYLSCCCWGYSSAHFSITKHHSPGDLKPILHSSNIWRPRCLRSEYQQGQVQVRTLFLACRWLSCCVLVLWSKGRLWSHISSFKCTILIVGAPTVWMHLKWITFQRPHLQISSRCGLRIQHMNVEGTQTLSIAGCKILLIFWIQVP